MVKVKEQVSNILAGMKNGFGKYNIDLMRESAQDTMTEYDS